MTVVLLLFLLQFAGIGYVCYVVARILFGMLCGSSNRVQPPDTDAPTGEVGPRSTATKNTFVPVFRKIHFYIFLAFDLAYSSLTFLAISPGDWSSWDSHPYRGILLTFSGPFSTAIFQPRDAHWNTAWGLFPYCAPFLLWGIFCQLVRLPFQRDPQWVAIAMWVIGLLAWFNGGVLSLILAA
jgi:hypothetical protein